MCGITGLMGPDSESFIDSMTAAVAHRGPDSRGVWTGPALSLGATRLAIVDVVGGHQPMRVGDHVLVANGEIYNHVELRRELESMGDLFSTQCDVEVILHGVRRYGVSFLPRLRGFFAFALWNGQEQTLLLARDRFGIAPLVWTELGERFAFASEVKAFEKIPEWRPELNLGALGDYLTHRYVAGPETLFQGVKHVPHGHWMERRPSGETKVQRWYQYPSDRREKLGFGEALERLEEAIETAVARRRQGEVPVGLYLSGGLDSSFIGAVSAGQGEPLPAYSHGFDPREDETSVAKQVAEHLGLAYHRVSIAPKAIEQLPGIVRAMEQPVANSDVIGLWELARRASEDVTVVLCGEGADELFGSYPHQQLLARLDTTPAPILRAGSVLLSGVPSHLLARLSSYQGAAADGAVRSRLADVLKEKTLSARYEKLVCLFSDEERRRFLGDMHRSSYEARERLVRTLDVADEPAMHRLVPMKFESWLPDYHLGRENRIAMAHGLEARYPFLDNDVVDAVAGIPLAYKTGWLPPREKKLLRRIAARRLPKLVAQRPKGPVRVPLGLFGNDFHAMLEDLLMGTSSRSRALFDKGEIEAIVRRARAGSFLAGRQAFAVLMLEVWLREWKVACP